MNLANFDLNLIIVFDAIFREGNLTLAGQRLGLSQPAISHSLARLRKVFNNPLFVRQGNQMMPTPLAEDLSLNMRKIITLAQRTIDDQGSFDPGSSTHIYKIGIQDNPLLVLMPKLLNEVRASAPDISFRIFHMNMETRKVALDDGNIELVIGGRQDFGYNTHQQYLFSDREVCILRKDHPRIEDAMTFEQYITSEFVGLSVSDFESEAIDIRLDQVGHKRKIVITVDQEVTIPHLISTTDLLANVAELIAMEYVKVLPVKILPIPIEPYRFKIFQYWHARNHMDPAHNWLRKKIKHICEAFPIPNH